jgi:RNA polymerase sigma-70 factor (ECF subfamily)
MTAIEFNYQLTGLTDSLRRFAYSLTSNREDASDLLQETFVKAISYRDKYADDTNLKAWTFYYNEEYVYNKLQEGDKVEYNF